MSKLAAAQTAIEPEWTHQGGDWVGWDFKNAHGLKIQVKQSAARQSWGQKSPSAGRFDVRKTAWVWDGRAWELDQKLRRSAHIYIFCWHDRYDAQCDQRDARQWAFYVMDASQLPADAKTISVKTLSRMCSQLTYDQLKMEVERLARGIGVL